MIHTAIFYHIKTKAQTADLGKIDLPGPTEKEFCPPEKQHQIDDLQIFVLFLFIHSMHRVIHKKQVFFLQKTGKTITFTDKPLILSTVIHSLWISHVYNFYFIHTTTCRKQTVIDIEHVCK